MAIGLKIRRFLRHRMTSRIVLLSLCLYRNRIHSVLRSRLMGILKVGRLKLVLCRLDKNGLSSVSLKVNVAITTSILRSTFLVLN
jgi:hypothetical protein